MADRFVTVFKQGAPIIAGLQWVMVDTETGVQYLFVQSGYAGGLTPLLDAEGRPVIDTKYKKGI